MELKLNIVMDNDAFADNPAWEVAWILEECSKAYADGAKEGVLRDTNGNSVGRFDTVEG